MTTGHRDDTDAAPQPDTAREPRPRKGDYRSPRMERLGDLRSTVLGGSPGSGDSFAPNTNPI